METSETLSLVIPCYNEKDTLHYLKEKLDLFLERAPIGIELILVDDGSTDGTSEEIKKHFSSYENFHLVINPTNLNVGGAMREGIKKSTGDYVAFLDSDCSYDPLVLIDMLKALKEGDYDCVSASFHHKNANISADIPAYRLVLSQGVQKIYNLLLLNNIQSYTSMFKLFKSSSLKRINYKANDFLAPAEMTVLAIMDGQKVLDFPADSQFRKFGTSKAQVGKIIKAHLNFMKDVCISKALGKNLN
jgi:glycosyltransferase involved in cell wall biosynthesis